MTTTSLHQSEIETLVGIDANIYNLALDVSLRGRPRFLFGSYIDWIFMIFFFFAKD